jgi:hypothetical protein
MRILSAYVEMDVPRRELLMIWLLPANTALYPH